MSIKETDKIIFLDIDGVLNYGKDLSVQLRPEKVKLLNQVLDLENVYIVISSTWRIIHTIKDIKNFLHITGLKRSDKIINATPKSRTGNRATEINNFIKRYNVKEFIVVDDEGTHIVDDPKLSRRFVKVDGMVGLSKNNISEMIRLLEEPTATIKSEIDLEWRRLVKQKMKEKDISWTELAKLVNMDQSNLYKMVNYKNITMNTLTRIFKGLGYNLIIDVEEVE